MTDDDVQGVCNETGAWTQVKENFTLNNCACECTDAFLYMDPMYFEWVPGKWKEGAYLTLPSEFVPEAPPPSAPDITWILLGFVCILGLSVFDNALRYSHGRDRRF